MSLDSYHAGIVRRMVLNRATWPNADLPMKRLGHDGPWEFGRIVEPPTPTRIVIEVTDPVKAYVEFPSIEKLIEAGWAVD